MIYYVSNLILSQSYDQAHDIIQQYGCKYWFESRHSGPCYKANIKKLEAIALYYQNKNVLDINDLLKEAQRKFTELNVYHGIAVCNFARAFCLYHKRFMFVNPSSRQ